MSIEDRKSGETRFEHLQRSVEGLPENEVRRRFVSLLEAIQPDIDCICSDLSEVAEGEAVACAHHSSRVGWIIHQARQLSPAE